MPVDRRRERKVVTVVFCDLVGFTARAESLDPEDVEAILRPYHERVRSELERHGGTVEKFIGDAVMALFGAPTAHEDDPERAVRAALAIRDFALEEGLELRVGVTTGEALVSLDANPAGGEGMAAGDVVNTAARLQSAAPVNGILVDETTSRATRGAIAYRAAAAVQAKGKTEPIAVWEATAARSRFGVDVTHHARTELVGRERELSILRDAFERACHERIPQLVTLVAVPGMGKSRLVFELQRIVEADPQLITWRQGRCLAYGAGIAFWALGEVVKAQAGILEQDSAEVTAEKLHAAVADALTDESDARWVESHLRPLVGLESETGLGGDRRGQAFAAWRRFLEALAERRPLVLVLEDLHWADDGLLDFVDELMDWLSEVPLLVVCTARPELLERRPGWGGGKINATTIGLTPLSADLTALLISRVLERPLLPADIQQVLLERAEGNPLFAEQFAQLYLERGSAEHLPLPETLQGILAARLDGLSGEEKALLQDAAVVGKVFWTGALRRDAEAAPLLHALERKGFLTRQRRTSVEGESEWAFAHMLLRDAAYGQIPRAERARKHRQAAEWIEGLARPDDHAELLAFHWGAALELARAAGQDTRELETPARLAFRAAGDRAFAVYAYPRAAAYFGEALALWPRDDPERPQLLYRRARALHIATDERALAALEEARDALIAAGDNERAAEAEAFISRIWWERGRRDDAMLHQQRAEQLAGGTSSPASARVLAFAARLRSIAGEPAEGLRLATDALAMARALDLPELEAHALATIGTAKGSMGDPSGADDLRQRHRAGGRDRLPGRVGERQQPCHRRVVRGRHASRSARPTSRRGASRSGSATGRACAGHAARLQGTTSSTATGTPPSARSTRSSPSARRARPITSSRSLDGYAARSGWDAATSTGHSPTSSAGWSSRATPRTHRCSSTRSGRPCARPNRWGGSTRRVRSRATSWPSPGPFRRRKRPCSCVSGCWAPDRRQASKTSFARSSSVGRRVGGRTSPSRASTASSAVPPTCGSKPEARPGRPTSASERRKS